MKKLLFLLPLVALAGCEDNNNEGEQVCTNKLWNLTETCDNTQSPPACNWLATYGETQSSATTVTVNEATYDHYIELGNVHNGSICWEGTQD